MKDSKQLIRPIVASRLLLMATLAGPVFEWNSVGAAILPGQTVQGAITATNASDQWTFTANPGNSIIVRVGAVAASGFSPKIQLLSPASALLGSSSGAVAAEVTAGATNGGTFTVVVSAGSSGQTGAYRLSLAQTGSPVMVSPGYQGGPMTNGVMNLGTILTGGLEAWTFAATNGDNLVVRMGRITDTNTFSPLLRLYDPSGALLGTGYYGGVAVEVATRATNSGTFLVVAADGNGVLSGSGDYRLTLAKTGDPVVVSPGQQGGPITNGVMNLGTILTGGLELWTFTATAGEAVIVRMGQITDTNGFSSLLRLYDPSGALLGTGYYGGVAVEVATRATNSGTFLVVAGDGNGVLSGSGEYRLTLAKTGDPVVVSPGQQGGPITNGVMNLGTILTGGLELWTFTATAGEAVIVRMGQITDTNSFSSLLRLYDPNGALLGTGYYGGVAVEVATRATNSGTFLVVAGDGNGVLSGSGDYRLTLAMTGSGLGIPAGDDGGPLAAGINPSGVITTGDMDVYAFTTCEGEVVSLRLDKLTDNGGFTPWLRLYGPYGALLASAAGTATPEATLIATNSGTYIVIVSDGNGVLSGTGTYLLTSNGLSGGMKLCTPAIAGANLNMSGIGGPSDALFILYSTTNVAAPAASWAPVLTNSFDQFGIFNYSGLVDPGQQRQYFRFLVP